jgi:hypothetical protein
MSAGNSPLAPPSSSPDIFAALQPFHVDDLSGTSNMAGSAAAHRGFATDRFAVSASPAGRTVLIIDDTWTTGSHAQSAAAALKSAGARGVGVLAMGRWMNVSWKNTPEWLHQHRGVGWDWNRCCLEP